MHFNFSVCLYYRCFLFFLSLSLFSFGLLFIIKTQIVFLDWSFISILGLDINFPLIFDGYGLIFSSLVLFISGNVFMFSDYYIKGEVFIGRFINIVVLFVLSINFLIFIPHLIILLLGWDGLGLVSFLLVIYYQNSKSLSAGILTALRNRIGDVFLLLRIGWCLSQGHWNIFNMWNNRFSQIIVLFIIFAAITKRAQIPFSRWLPAAIAAPTPVSALVHSSTLVTAGVFLMVRFYPFLRRVKIFNNFILIISCITIFIAGMSALFECDIKKIVALSTLSQLGVIMSAIGLGLPILAFFHILTHALFKALLFVCVGSLINLHSHRQDLRIIGNLVSQLPLTTSCLNIANMALCGLPFLSGFYSKDLIIEISLYNNYGFIIIFLFLFATMITSCYRVRLVLRGITRTNIGLSFHNVSDNSNNNTVAIIFLRLGGVFGGCVLNWLFIAPLVDPVLPTYLKLIAFIVTLLGGYIIYGVVIRKSSHALNNPLLTDISCYIWFIVPLSTQIIIKRPLYLGKYNLMLIDQGWLEEIGGQGLFSFIKSSFSNYRSIYSLNLSSYLVILLRGIRALLLIIISFITYICSDSLTLSVTLKLLRWFV